MTLRRVWARWTDVLIIVKPITVVVAEPGSTQQSRQSDAGPRNHEGAHLCCLSAALLAD
jgi:hypothetical protein